MFELRTLGILDLRRTGGGAVGSLIAQPKRLAVIVYMATASTRGLYRRDTLLPLFWPESDEQHARNALSQTLHHIRRSLGPEALENRGGEEVGLSPDAVWCDAVAFDEAVRSDRFEKAVELYQGDFLVGFHIHDAAGFELWVQNEREQRKRQVVRAASALAAAEESRGNLAGAAFWLRRTMTLAPAEESALRSLIRLLCATGDRSEAVHAYDVFARRLAAEYDLEPSPDTRALLDELMRRESGVASSADTDGAAGAPDSPVERPTAVVTVKVAAGAPPRDGDGRGSAPKRRPTRRAALAAFVAVLAIAVWFAVSATGTADGTSSGRDIPILVLPFENLGPGEHEYFAYGVTEEIMAALATVPGFRILSRTTAYRYRDAEMTLREIASELAVDYVLEGTVRWQPDPDGPGRVRVIPRLVRVQDEAQVWAEDFEADFADIFAVQDSIARGVSERLMTRLAGGLPRVEIRGTTVPEAHVLVLKARYMQEHRTGGFPEVRQPQLRELFEKAIERDSGYAAAWAGLARIEVVDARLAGGDVRKRRAHLERAEAAARKAVRLADASAESHVALGVVLGDKGDWPGAERAFLRGINLDRNMAEAYALYAYLLVALDRVDEARDQFARAQSLEPTSPELNIQQVRALLFVDRNYRAALDQARELMEWQPDPWLPSLIGMAFQRLEQDDSAIHWLQAWSEEAGLAGRAASGELLYDAQGDREGLRRLLDSMKQHHRTGNRPEAINIARLHARLGDRDSTFVWLEKVSWNVPLVNHLLYEFPFDSIRADPRYTGLLKQIGVR